MFLRPVRRFWSTHLGDVPSMAAASTGRMNGRSKERQELVEAPLPLKATVAVVPSRGGEDLLRRLFEPLGYAVTATRHPLDKQFASWGDGPYYTLTIEQALPLQSLLQHLYVLVPVLDNDKHYWVGEDEVEKLLARGEPWRPRSRV